jgi:hypothetical protein
MIHVDPELVSTVQFNCDLSDARFAGNYTMCIYLLKMREFYRWHHGLPLRESLSMKAVGEWVQQREGRWDAIESRDWEPLPVDGDYLDVFDDEPVNQRLSPERVVFSSGIGRFGKPVFFLAECLESRRQQDFTVYVAGREYARELAAPPAMIRGDRIFLRRQSLERMLWESIEEWRWHRRPGAMERVYEHYGFDADPDRALADLVEDQIEQLLLHEKGEHLAGKVLTGEWESMLLDVVGSGTENVVRAVRDCFADCLAVLPALIESDRPELVHFYFAIQTPLRKELFPALTKRYREWVEGASLERMSETVDAACGHFEQVAKTMIRAHRNGARSEPGADAIARIAF